MKKKYHNPVGVGKYTGLMYITPFIVGFVLFTAYPFVYSFVTGLTDTNGIGQAHFVGADNFKRMLTDEAFKKSLAVTLKYTAVLVPLKLIFSLMTALLLNADIRFIGAYRTIFYIPSILGSNLAVVIMWQFLFTSGGLADQLLGLVAIAPAGWYGDAAHAMGIIILLRLWEFGSCMIIFLNALRDIPREIYEAARVDGCGGVRSFFSITLPLLKNVIFLNLVLQIISTVQEFNAPYMITGGGPLKSTYTLGMLIYDEMFRYHDVGYANALSWAMFTVTAIVIALVFGIRREKRDIS